MPIISKIGARSIHVRLVYLTIYILLFVGAATMFYPFMLMLSGSFKSQTDILEITPWPRFWFDDDILFQKYAESKYNVDITVLEASWQQYASNWYKLQPPQEIDQALLNDYLEWRPTCRWWILGHASGSDLLPRNGREFRYAMADRYNEDISAFAAEMGLPLKAWSSLNPPVERVFRRPVTDRPLMRAWKAYAEKQPVHDRAILNLDGQFWVDVLMPKYTRDIEQYNYSHGTDYKSYKQVLLTPRAPALPRPELTGDWLTTILLNVPDYNRKLLRRTDWELYVRNTLWYDCIRIDKQAQPDFQSFLARKYNNDIALYNDSHKTNIKRFAEVSLSTTLPETVREQVDWGDFLASPFCKLDHIEVFGPRQDFEQFLADKRGVDLAEVTPTLLPTKQADWHDCMAHSGDLRWELSTRNYKQVFDYILLHGRGVRNTVIYCGLAVLMALLVNPLAAYALSRWKPPSTYTVLLICMATMSFPNEVAMIPRFLLLKRFPLWPLVGGFGAFLLAFSLFSRYARHRISEIWRVVFALSIGILVGVYFVPALMGKPHISLLNTFAALVMPRMANGYMVFLLKGFFDSIPRELYEAADLDGAGEVRKFWSFTMALSTPILAVIALRAFTLAYSQFMMALIIIPDQNMWTLMVWIFQLQSQAHQAVIYTSLVVAAIPSLIVFLACQGVIMKGIVVPTEK